MKMKSIVATLAAVGLLASASALADASQEANVKKAITDNPTKVWGWIDNKIYAFYSPQGQSCAGGLAGKEYPTGNQILPQGSMFSTGSQGTPQGVVSLGTIYDGSPIFAVYTCPVPHADKTYCHNMQPAKVTGCVQIESSMDKVKKLKNME